MMAIPSDSSPEHSRRASLSRTPQPYLRHQAELPDRFHTNRSAQLYSQPRRHDTSQTLPHRRPKPLPRDSTGYFSSDSQRRRPGRAAGGSASDSGTEADDEKPLLKALTAPPPRPRKGLKVARGATAADALGSPLLTPSFLEEERRRLDQRPARGGGGGARRGSSKPVSEEEAERARATQRRRERAEYARRVLEAASLLGVGYLSLPAAGVARALDAELDAGPWYGGEPGRELLCHAALVLGIYATYPLRLLWHFGGFERWWTNFYVSAAADPAPLLYPVLLPLFVALALRLPNPWIIPVNYVLSIAAMPRGAIPLNDFSTHWLLSILPMSFYGPETMSSWPPFAGKGYFVDSELSVEALTLLFPLHQSLRQALGFLTTTSLLPTELQLLTLGLANLLLFAEKPPLAILKAVLWIGGLCLFVACRHVLQWSVRLARVPSWRFRRSRAQRLEKHTLLCAVNDTFGGLLGSSLFSPPRGDSSDSEMDGFAPRPRSGHSRRKNLSHASPKRPEPLPLSEPPTAVDDIQHRLPSAASPEPQPLSPRQRRHTLAATPASLPEIPVLTRSATLALAQLRRRPPNLLSLTRAQAAVLRALYAAYAYAAIALIILVPIRLYVGRVALADHEPVGWALGYLLGDVPAFRLRTLLWSLDAWIPLPTRHPACPPAPLPAAERLRVHAVGITNTRLFLFAYYLVTLAAGLRLVARLRRAVEVDTRRKLFHGMAVAMFLPTAVVDPALVALALALVLAVFLLLDLVRAAQLPPVSRPLTAFLAPFVDGRDHRGPVVVSHVFLLVGCAVPLWLSLAAAPAPAGAGRGDDDDGWAGDAFAAWQPPPARDLALVAGVVCVGLGDAAASLVGRRAGRHRWAWSGGKSLEGSAAFAAAVWLGLAGARAWLALGGWPRTAGAVEGWRWARRAALAAGVASFTEAVLTGGNDNVVVPVVLWVLVRGLGL